jgi:hypothetical protein
LLSKDGDGRVLGGRPRPRPLLRDIRHVNVALSERVSVTDTYLEAGGGVFLLSAALLRLPCLGSSSSSSSSSTSSLMHKSNDHHHHYLDSHYTLVLHQCRRASPLYVVSSLLLILIISIGKGLLTWKLSHGSATRPIVKRFDPIDIKSSKTYTFRTNLRDRTVILRELTGQRLAIGDSQAGIASFDFIIIKFIT